MVKISVFGGRGRMGIRVCRLVKENPELELVGIIEDSKNPDISSEIEGVKVVADIAEGIAMADVVIDFSTPESTMKLIKCCELKNTKLVIGTTGFNVEQNNEIEKYAQNIPVLLSPNMSVGVNLVFKIIKEITGMLPGYEKEIIEAHHNQKVDSPSGTALKIAKIISSEKDRLVFGREGKTGPRKKNEVGIHAVRGGSIVGEHTVMWIGSHEIIELTHKAQSRDVFAQGAVRAAIWLNGRQGARVYSMEDVLE